MHPKILEIISKSIKKETQTFNVGDTVRVTVRIKEGNKERNQNYEGVVIKTKGANISKTFTVRRVFQGVGVERVFFFNSPKIEKIKVMRTGKTRRAKLYYLRERTGKATKVKEQLLSSGEGANILQEEIPQEGKLVEVSS